MIYWAPGNQAGTRPTAVIEALRLIRYSWGRSAMGGRSAGSPAH